MSRQWYDEKEQVKTSAPLFFTLWLVKVMPRHVMGLIIFPVAFFYWMFSPRARKEIKRFQTQLKEYTGGHLPKKESVYRTIYSFSSYLVERISGWLGKIQAEDIFYNDDDIDDFWENLDRGQGCFIIGSHLGNLDLLRSLSTMCRAGVDRKVPVTVIMEIKSVEKFNAMLKKVNPDYELTALDPKDINPETIIDLQEKIKAGEIVVATGDRISAHSANRFIRKKFLGREASFPYGIFLMASLLECPVYFCFGLRDEPVMIDPVNAVYMHKADTEFSGCGRKEREARINQLCEEFVIHLERYCMWFPNQWYNFYDFWSDDGVESK